MAQKISPATLRDDPASLVSIMETTSDLVVLSSAAGLLTTCLLKVAPLDTYVEAFLEFGCPECMKYLPDTWLESDKNYEVTPAKAASVVARRLQILDLSAEGAMEAAASLLGVLLELVRDRQRADVPVVRGMLVRDSSTGFVKAIARIMLAAGHCTNLQSGNGQSEPSEAPSKTETPSTMPWGDAAYLNACLLLAHVAQGDWELVQVLQSAGVPQLVSGRLIGILEHQEHPKWECLTTASTQLLEVVICTKDPAMKSLRPQVDALLLVLEKSLRRGGTWPGQCMVVQLMHASALKGLKHIAHFSADEARYIVQKQGLHYGAQVLCIRGADQEALSVTFGYLSQLLSAVPNCQKELAPLRLVTLVTSVVNRFARFPGAAIVMQEEAAYLLEVIDKVEAIAHVQDA